MPGDIHSYKYFNVTDMLHGNLEFLEVTEQPAGFTFEENSQSLSGLEHQVSWNKEQ